VRAVTTVLERPSDSPDLLDHELSRLPRREATQRLLDLAHEADEAGRAAYQARVVELNMQIAVDVARRYRSRGVAVEDLEQVAYLGLVKAVRGFDAERATDFLSYAVPTIRGEVRRYFRDHGWAVRPPRSVQQAQSRITAVESDLCQELGRAPRPSEIAERLDLDIDLVVEALAANGCFVPTSLDLAVGTEERATLAERIASEDVGPFAVDARVILAPAVKDLSTRDQRILYLRFFEGRNQREIGDEIGVTQMQVSRLLARILRDLRRSLDLHIDE
jgi:RNA polymerase sigma-B factor